MIPVDRNWLLIVRTEYNCRPGAVYEPGTALSSIQSDAARSRAGRHRFIERRKAGVGNCAKSLTCVMVFSIYRVTGFMTVNRV